MLRPFDLDYQHEPREDADERIARALAILHAAGQRARQGAQADQPEPQSPQTTEPQEPSPNATRVEICNTRQA